MSDDRDSYIEVSELVWIWMMKFGDTSSDIVILGLLLGLDDEV